MKKECCGITIDLGYDNNLTEFSKKLLRDYYMQDHEESPQESFARAAVAFSFNSCILAWLRRLTARRTWCTEPK